MIALREWSNNKSPVKYYLLADPSIIYQKKGNLQLSRIQNCSRPFLFDIYFSSTRNWKAPNIFSLNYAGWRVGFFQRFTHWHHACYIYMINSKKNAGKFQIWVRKEEVTAGMLAFCSCSRFSSISLKSPASISALGVSLGTLSKGAAS